MTREEAIAFFEDMNECTYGNLEAVEMAISALSTEGEYIKKEDALKALHDFWDECIGYDGSGTEMMLDNESVINSLPTYSFPDSAEDKGEWIPVSERLPEEAFPCYVTIEEDDRFGEPYAEIYPEFVGYDGETWNDSEGKSIPFEVIAWCKKPEPYQKGGEE